MRDLVRAFHASVPFFVFRMNVAKPQIALVAVHGRGKIAWTLIFRGALALALGPFLVF